MVLFLGIQYLALKYLLIPILIILTSKSALCATNGELLKNFNSEKRTYSCEFPSAIVLYVMQNLLVRYLVNGLGNLIHCAGTIHIRMKFKSCYFVVNDF